MSTGEYLLNFGLLGVMIGTQWGSHAMTLRRVIVPLVIVAGVGAYFLSAGIPTLGGDQTLEASLAAAGIAFGLLAGAVVDVTRDGRSGRVMVRAGLAYAAVWCVALGGRVLFAWGATTVWSEQIVQFSRTHEITGSAAWTAAFVLMALAMVITRTAVLGTRTALLRAHPLPSMAL